MQTPEIHVNDVVQLRKPHPCGSSQWKVVRVGADIGLSCLGCGRRVMLTRHDLRRRMKAVVSSAAPTGSPDPDSDDRSAPRDLPPDDSPHDQSPPPAPGEVRP